MKVERKILRLAKINDMPVYTVGNRIETITI